MRKFGAFLVIVGAILYISDNVRDEQNRRKELRRKRQMGIKRV